MHHNSRGIAYVSLEWVFVFIQTFVIGLRVYSRTFLTRSVGSDDFFIVIAYVFNVVPVVSDLEAFLHGWSQHEADLTTDDLAAETKWEYTSYIQVYIVYFLIRTSVMLFVLRLLPSYKTWQPRFVYLAFLLNLLVTAYTCIAFGVSCIPFNANWKTVPNAKCFSKDILVITNQVNAALACVCDIVTACIPQLLLWNVQMRKKTKRQLNALFGFGLITAALSVARAATITKKTLTEDTTWNMIPAFYLSMFESNLGLIFACGPAIRQFWAYRSRTHSSLPRKERQYPNEDFVKMRYRVNLRDIFWYRKAHMVGDRVFDAAPIFRDKSQPPPEVSSGSPQSSSQVSNSILDVWNKKIRRLYNGNGPDHKDGRHSSLQINSDDTGSSKNGRTFLLSDSGIGTTTTATGTANDWPLSSLP